LKDGLKSCHPAKDNVENKIKIMLQVDKSINISDKAPLLAYVHFIHESELFCVLQRVSRRQNRKTCRAL
jgi:hypothetical protein